MRERDIKSRIDYTYPFTRIDQDGFATELFNDPPPFEISFFYQRSKNKAPAFIIFAIRIDKFDE